MASSETQLDSCSSTLPENDHLESHLGDSLSIKARQLFTECDLENKGYVTRIDMSLLEGLVPLSTEKLQLVFDTLDEKKTNQLSLEEFTDGFGMFLGIAANKCDSRKVRKLQMANCRPLSPIRELNDPYEDFLDQIGCRILFKDEHRLRALFEYLKMENREMLPVLQDFLLRISGEFENYEWDQECFERAFQDCNSSEEEQILCLYSKMKQRLEGERQENMEEKDFRNQRLKQKLEDELEIKNKILVEIQRQQQEMQEKVLRLQFEESTRRKENELLKKEKYFLETKLMAMCKHRGMETQLKTIDKDVCLTKERHQRESNELLTPQKKDFRIPPDLNHEEEEAYEDSEIIPIHRYRHQQVNPFHDFNGCLDSIHRSAENRQALKIKTSSEDEAHHLTSPYAFPTSISYTEDCQFYEYSNQVNWKVSCNLFQDEYEWSKPHWKVKLKLSPNRQKTILCREVNEEGNSEVSEASDACDGNSDPERVFKIILVGDSGVGKSSFIHRFCTDSFRTNFASTVGMDFQVKSVLLNNQRVALQFWDPAGQERFRCICKQYFRKADAAVIMYDVTYEKSFTNVRQWLGSLQENSEDEIVLLLIGNKTDAIFHMRDKLVSSQHGYRLAKEYDALFYETSAKTGFNVQEAVKDLISLLKEKEDINIENFLKLEDNSQKRKWRC